MDLLSMSFENVPIFSRTSLTTEGNILTSISLCICLVNALRFIPQNESSRQRVGIVYDLPQKSLIEPGA